MHSQFVSLFVRMLPFPIHRKTIEKGLKMGILKFQTFIAVFAAASAVDSYRAGKWTHFRLMMMMLIII